MPCNVWLRARKYSKLWINRTSSNSTAEDSCYEILHNFLNWIVLWKSTQIINHTIMVYPSKTVAKTIAIEHADWWCRFGFSYIQSDDVTRDSESKWYEISCFMKGRGLKFCKGWNFKCALFHYLLPSCVFTWVPGE